MGQSERLAKLGHLLKSGRCLKPAILQQRFEVSAATVQRDIRQLRDRHNLPVVWSNEDGGWRLDKTQSVLGPQFEVPGLWLNAEEVHALLTMQHLLSNLDSGGLLGPYIAPWMKRLGQAMAEGMPPNAEVAKRIRVQTVGARRYALPHFQAVGSALLQRRRLVISYHARSDDQTLEREVSPQRLVHYRDNWYLDAWCHARSALRSFSLDAIQAVKALGSAAFEVADHQLDDALGAGYGIFSGEGVHWAVLRFSPHRARWVAAEKWHANQLGRWDATGHWVLSVPYSDARELVMEILRHVPDVQVMSPPELQAEVFKRLRAGLAEAGVDE